MTTEFEVNALPAPGSPFHLAIPVHDMREGKSSRFVYKLYF
jgi:hypothetical protein